MEIRKTIPIYALIVLIVSFNAFAYHPGLAERLEHDGAGLLQGTAAPCVSANFNFTIGDLWYPAVYTVGITLETGYYPGSSGNLQIYQGGAWAGGFVVEADAGEPWTAIGTFDQLDFLMYDSVCSGFNVAQPAHNYIEVSSTFDTYYSPTDLGVEHTLTYKMWGDPQVDDFVIIQADLKFNKAVRHFWWGWLNDCDIGNNSLPDYYYDDLTGYDTQSGVAYMYDDDGDPVAESDPTSKLLSPTHVGQVLLAAPPPGGAITEAITTNVAWETFSWWDWNNDVTSGASAYERMATGQIKESPPETPFDYRIMTAIGPYEADAGDEATFVFAIVFGDGLDQSYWTRRAQAGAEVSPMGNLLDHAETAKMFYANGLEIDDPAPAAPDLDEPLLEGREVELSWQSVSEEDDDFAGYRVYRSLVSNVGPWDLIGHYPGRPFVNTHLDTLRIGFPTFYLATAYDIAGNESTTGSMFTKTVDGVYATTKPTDYTGDCEDYCAAECQGCPECYERCMESCMAERLANPLDNILVAPNPYRGSAAWERQDYESRISFYNLPKRCTIYIHSMTGELINTVPHNMSGDPDPDPPGTETGGESWDMLTYNNQSIASGIYIYRVVSPEYGEKIGKFAVIKGE
jgi:hypothetical protein